MLSTRVGSCARGAPEQEKAANPTARINHRFFIINNALYFGTYLFRFISDRRYSLDKNDPDRQSAGHGIVAKLNYAKGP